MTDWEVINYENLPDWMKQISKPTGKIDSSYTKFFAGEEYNYQVRYDVWNGELQIFYWRKQNKVEKKNAKFAGVLSFLSPGLGHVYNGDCFRWIVFLLVTIGFFVSRNIFGTTISIIIYLYGIYDTYSRSTKMNNGEIPYQKRTTIHAVILSIFVGLTTLAIIAIIIVIVMVMLGVVGTGGGSQMGITQIGVSQTWVITPIPTPIIPLVTSIPTYQQTPIPTPIVTSSIVVRPSLSIPTTPIITGPSFPQQPSSTCVGDYPPYAYYLNANTRVICVYQVNLCKYKCTTIYDPNVRPFWPIKN
jgi:TM2 domain-containing membrane protein YozV